MFASVKNVGRWVLARTGPKSNRIRCQKMYAPIETRRTHFIWSILANLSCHFKGTFWWYSRWFYRGTSSLRQRCQRFHFNCRIKTFADHIGRKTYRRRSRTIAGQPRRFTRQCQLRRICSCYYERLNFSVLHI